MGEDMDMDTAIRCNGSAACAAGRIIKSIDKDREMDRRH